MNKLSFLTFRFALVCAACALALFALAATKGVMAKVAQPVPGSTPALKSKPTPASTPKRVSGSKKELEPKWPSPTGDDTAIPNTVELQETQARERFEKAKSFLFQRKPDEAVPLLREAEKLEPKRYEIQLLLGATFGMLRRTDDALNAFQIAVDLNPKSAEAHFGLCRVMAETNKRIEAVDECKEAVRLDPEKTIFRTHLAELYMLDERSREALQLLDAASARSQNDLLYLGTLGDAYYMEGEYARAAEVYERMAQKWPAISIIYLRLSGVYEYLDRTTDTIRTARKFLELEPKLLLAYLNLGGKLQAAGFFDESIEPLQKAIALDPTCGDAYLALSESYEVTGDSENTLASLRNAYQYSSRTVQLSFRLGTALEGYGYKADAVEPLERANSMAPNLPEIMRALGLVYIDVNRFDEGIDLFDRAAQLSPLPPGITIDLSRVRASKELLNRFDEILENVRKNPTDIRARYDLAEAYLFKGMRKETEEQYLEITKLAPRDYRNYNGLGIFYADNGEFEKAVEMTRKAIELNPHHVLYITLSYHLSKLGRLDEAIEAAKRSVAIKSTLLESRLWLGELLVKKGLREEALREYQAGFDLASGDPRPNFKLAWLYIRMGNKEGAFRHYGILKGIAPRALKNLELSLRAHFGPLP